MEETMVGPGLEGETGERHGRFVHQTEYFNNLRNRKPNQPQRRRPGVSCALGVSLVGFFVVAHTFWLERERRATAADRIEEMLAQIPESEIDASPWSTIEKFLETETQNLDSLSTSEGARPEGNSGSGSRDRTAARVSMSQGSLLRSNSSNALPLWPTPIIKSVDTGDQVLRDSGGSDITVRGANFGDVDAEVRVKVGDTWSPRTEWISNQMLVAKSPMGVGADLPLAVWVWEPVHQPAMGVASGVFSYSRPFIYDIMPFTVGSPLEGPFNVTLKAWGIGYWDTHPVAQLNGQACHRTFWVDNATVVCEIPTHARIAPLNPEIKVAGQRSMCGVLAPGVCTVSVNHASVSSPARIRQQIREIKAHGGDWRAALAELRGQNTIGGWGRKNSPEDPCTNIGNCTPRTFVSSLSGAVMMMLGMGSLCLLILVTRPLSIWLTDDWRRAREEATHGEYDDLLDNEGQPPLAGPTQQLFLAEEEDDSDEDEDQDEDEHRERKMKKTKEYTFDVRVF